MELYAKHEGVFGKEYRLWLDSVTNVLTIKELYNPLKTTLKSINRWIFDNLRQYPFKLRDKIPYKNIKVW